MVVKRVWHQCIGALTAVAFAVGATHVGRGDSVAGPAPYGLSARIPTVPYLRMPHNASGQMPALLSQTGVLTDARTLAPATGLIPYDLVVAFWSDGAGKTRWVAIPDQKVKFSANGEWKFPQGTVFVKTFELATDARDPGVKRRLETRILVLDDAGGVYGVDYKWRPDNSDADLLPAGSSDTVSMRSATGQTHDQVWSYPSREDCLTCHNARAGSVLGVKTRQMNHSFNYAGVTDNELRAWNHAGLLDTTFTDGDLSAFATLASANDGSRSVEDRARSYLDANCSHCHQPGGTVANFDARYGTPLDEQQLVQGPVLIDQGIDRPRIIAPHDIWRSIAYMRVNTTGDIRMPPLARNTIDPTGVRLLHDWILSMPGRAVLDPPSISPAGGTFAQPIEVTLAEPEPGTEIRYTLDGSVPGPSDPHYENPIPLTGSAVLRTRAYKEGFSRSIITQEVFVIGQ